MMCSEDAALLKRFVEKEKIFKFIPGLNMEYDQKQSQVLGKDELPSLNETIFMIWEKERRWGVMIKSQVVDGSTMVSSRNLTMLSNGGSN